MSEYDDAFAESPHSPDQPLSPDVSRGARLLDDVAAWFRRFVHTMTDADHDLLALWTVHSHVAEASYTTPRLQLDSPMPGSGKTTVLEHLSRLCMYPISMASLSSPALLSRMLDKGPRTILIDEADRSLSPDKPGVEELLAVLNSGYKRGGTRPVLIPTKGGGWDVSEMPTFAPVALAGNQPKLPEDTSTRIIRVLLLPDLDGVADESDWELIEGDAAELAARIKAWADLIRERVRTCRPALPEGITGRFREKWGPLARIAEIAGGRWPESVAAMALQDREQFDMDKEDGLIRERPAILLLRNIHEIWPEGETFVPSTHLVASLVSTFPSSWGVASPYGKELTTHRLGRMLAANYRVNSTRPGNSGPRGYTAASLAPAWHQLGFTRTPTYGSVEAAEAVEVVTDPPDSPLQPDSPDLFGGVARFCERCESPVDGHNVLCSACIRELADAMETTT